jgi:flagellar basal body P-ring formation protein FlgA
MIMALPMLFALASQPPGCLPVQDDRIYAHDVAAAIPEFSRLPAGLSLGYSPAPGVQRVFPGSMLRAIARNQGVTLDAAPQVCFIRPMMVLEADQILEAMRTSWSGPDIRVDLRSWSPRTAPKGELVFPSSGVKLPGNRGPESEAVWRGYVLYGNNLRFTVTARARVLTASTRVVAVDDIAAGTPVREDQVRLDSCDACMLDDRPVRSLDQAVGLVARTQIRSGAIILKNQLNRPPEVARGDLVTVDVSSGAAHLVVEGRAQSSGVTGSTVTVRNPTSGKDFQARVTGNKKVSVQ